MLGPTTHPNRPNAETSSGEGQRKKSYCVAWAHCGKRHRKYFSPSWGLQRKALCLNQERMGEGRERCVVIKQSLAKCDLIVIPVLVLLGVQEMLFITVIT
jgi:hypothetical protein